MTPQFDVYLLLISEWDHKDSSVFRAFTSRSAARRAAKKEADYFVASAKKRSIANVFIRTIIGDNIPSSGMRSITDRWQIWGWKSEEHKEGVIRQYTVQQIPVMGAALDALAEAAE